MVFKTLFKQFRLYTLSMSSMVEYLWNKGNKEVFFLVVILIFDLWFLSSPGAATAFFEAAGAASAATGFGTGETAAPSREYR